MRVHPFADKFPLLPEEDLHGLTESIRAHGLRHPIVLDDTGRILDGRNRQRACDRLGIKPDYITYAGNDFAEYVIDCNTMRRHMSVGARAMATALVLEELGRDYGVISREILNGLNSSFRVSISYARKIIDYIPSLVDDVINDQIGIRKAYEQAREIEASREAEKIAKRNRRFHNR